MKIAVLLNKLGLAMTSFTMFEAKPSNRDRDEEAGCPSLIPSGLMKDTAGSVLQLVFENRAFYRFL